MPRVVPRSEWGARYPVGPKVSLPWSLVVIHTEAGAVRDEDWPAIIEAAQAGLSLTESQHARSLERYVAVNRGFGQSAYSFFIFEDGTIIECNGWGRRQVATQGHNSDSVSICFSGHGDVKEATGAQWAAARWLIGEGIRIGALTPNPDVQPHNKYARKSCPGTLNTPHLDRLRGINGPITPTTPEQTEEQEIMGAKDEIISQVNTTIRETVESSLPPVVRVADSESGRKANQVGRVYCITPVGKWWVQDNVLLSFLYVTNVVRYDNGGNPKEVGWEYLRRVPDHPNAEG